MKKRDSKSHLKKMKKRSLDKKTDEASEENQSWQEGPISATITP
jgi:hypothetical protein